MTAPQYRIATLLCCLVLVCAAHPNSVSASDDAQDCVQARQSADLLNYAALKTAQQNCRSAGDTLSANFFVLTSRIRFAADNDHLKAVASSDRRKKSAILNYLYTITNRFGWSSVYRDRDKTKALLTALNEWTPQVNEKYDPGWRYKKRPPPDVYVESYKRHRFNLLERLKRHIAAVQNDEFYQNFLKLEEFYAVHERNKGFSTEEFRALLDLDRTLAALRKPMNLRKPAYKFPPRPRVEPDANFQQIFTGINGPPHSGFVALGDKEAFDESWLAYTLTAETKERVLSKVDFNTHLLVVISTGRQRHATGSAVLTKLTRDEHSSGYAYTVATGKLDHDCEFQGTPVFPFVLAVMPRPTAPSNFKGKQTGERFFADGCTRTGANSEIK